MSQVVQLTRLGLPDNCFPVTYIDTESGISHSIEYGSTIAFADADGEHSVIGLVDMITGCPVCAFEKSGDNYAFRQPLEASDILFGGVSPVQGSFPTTIEKTQSANTADGATSMQAWGAWGWHNVATGPQGAKGPSGSSGVRGIAGATGPTGGTGLQGPIGRRGTGIAGAKGKTAPLSRYMVGANMRRLLFPESDFRKWASYPTRKTRMSGKYSDGRGEDMISLLVADIDADYVRITGKVSFTTEMGDPPSTPTTTNFGPYDIDATVFRTQLENADLVNPLVLGDFSFGTSWFRVQLETVGAYETRKCLSSRIIASGTFYGPASTIMADESQERMYLYPQADNSPTDGDSLQLVTSGGVATAYCALIDKLAQYKGLSAAQVAMMKALYGA